jgi:hypothetical protein
MKPIALVSVLVLVTSACAQQPAVEPAAPAAAPAERVGIALSEAHSEPAVALRQAGDYVVFRFTGSYRDKPVTLTQRVIDRQGDVLVLDVMVDDGSAQKRLRLRMDDTPGGSGELLSVARLEGGVQRPFGVAAFEKLMSEIVPSVDDNQGVIGSLPVRVSLGQSELDATRTSYRVRVGAHTATMHTVSATGFAWGDVGGEITTDKGKLIYKAEIVDIGGPASAAMAVHNGDDLYEELE